MRKPKTGIEQLKPRRKLRTLDKYVVFSIAALIAFSVVEFVFSLVTGIHHDTLTTCFYAAFGGEILSCCLIKIFKLKDENHY